MTGSLETPELKAKNVTDGQMGKVLVEGWVNGTGSAAQILMSNKKYNTSNAYGALTWHGSDGSGWFQFDHDVDLSSKGLHSVGHIRFNGGSKTLVEVTSVRITFDGRTIIAKGNSATGAGFEIKGHTNEGNDHKLLQVYHNGNNSLDAVNYYGKTEAESNIATVGYVKSIVGGDSDVSGDTPFTPYGPLKTTSIGRTPGLGEISFSDRVPNETTTIALSKTDQDGKVWDYKFNKDSIFTVSIVDDVTGDADIFRQTVSVRVDDIEDKGSWIVLTVDCRDLSSKQREESSGIYYFVTNPLFWCLNEGADATPLQKVPITFDEMFQFRDETSIFPTYMQYDLSTSSGDSFSGANQGRLYMENSLTDPRNIRLCLKDKFGYGFLGRVDKNAPTSIVSVPGEMTMFARSKWSKQIVPVEGYYFDSLYFNHSKESCLLYTSPSPRDRTRSRMPSSA